MYMYYTVCVYMQTVVKSYNMLLEADVGYPIISVPLPVQYEMFRQRVPQGILTPDQFTGLTQHLTKQTIDLIQS